MSTKPKFDPSQVTNLLSRGTAEARGTMRPLAFVPSADTLAQAPSVDGDAAAPTTSSADSHIGQSEEATEAAIRKPPKRAITVRLSDEVLAALYRHQAEVRCTPGARLGDTTIGGVIDTLLREQLHLGQAL